MKEIRVAILGFGGIARAHKKGYDLLREEGFPVRLVAICDIDEQQFYKKSTTNLGTELRNDFEGIHLYTNDDDMLQKEEFDTVDICLPTYLHKEYAIKMMRAGKHVQSEKPMSLYAEDCEEMIRVANETGKKLMIGQCLRFDAAYLYLKKCITDGCFGALRRLVMDRLSTLPRWGFEGWFHDVKRSGGVPLDLHIHDIDMARFLLGEPTAVSSVTMDATMPMQYMDTRLFYDHVSVFAHASWDEAATIKFSASYRARFETATVLCQGNEILVFPDKGEAYQVNLPKKNHMAEEIRAMAYLVGDPTFENTVNTPESACQSVKLVHALMESARLNGQIIQLS